MHLPARDVWTRHLLHRGTSIRHVQRAGDSRLSSRLNYYVCLCARHLSRLIAVDAQGETLAIFTLTVFFVALTMMGFRLRWRPRLSATDLLAVMRIRKFCEMLVAGRLRWDAVLPILANSHGVYVSVCLSAGNCVICCAVTTTGGFHSTTSTSPGQRSSPSFSIP
jgi:hypothetical protein